MYLRYYILHPNKNFFSGDCTFVQKGDFIKNLCYRDNKFELYKCPDMSTYYTFLLFNSLLYSPDDMNFASATKTCPNDPRKYQTCFGRLDNRKLGDISIPFCRRYFKKYDNVGNRFIYNLEVKYHTDIKYNNDGSDSIRKCDGFCNDRNCLDEASCNGFFYGLNCGGIPHNIYVSPAQICDG